ncbi:neuroendocrine convertase 1-like [Centruroides sculpturatus]|uniref:neuroendocrine convertase 1-like n=1 Tax=Centruroides sculpturatus TaxID=218467 RepID=UPI000C6D535A|nr:neuroendocrine convertase 1-like [Centruroides sculpturatus]
MCMDHYNNDTTFRCYYFTFLTEAMSCAKFSIWFLCILFHSHYSYGRHFTNDWAVQLNGGDDMAKQLADEMGYYNLGQIRGFPNVYLLRKKEHPSRSKREAKQLNKILNEDPRVLWAEQQEIRVRDKRNLRLVGRNGDFYVNRFNDQLWPKEWYLHNSRSENEITRSMNVIPVWDMGYTGRGVVLSVMDDGLEWNHTDLIRNYDSRASWDSNDNDPDPFPRYDDVDSNKHGTRCAGVIAMIENNLKCGVGIAYNSKIGAIRMLDGPITDVIEGLSIAFNIDYIDIFTASWGPTDDGKTVDGPKTLASKALEKGAIIGRNGRGVIYIWASGNGGFFDNCNCDGYVSSIYTLSIGSVSYAGKRLFYSEKCSSTIATTYSSGYIGKNKICATDLHDKCTNQHSGTSASAPMAAGIIALVLEANPYLTWRDIHHIIVWTTDVMPLLENKGWKMNSIGLMYNSQFGFGLLNAEAMVKTAVKWEYLPQKTTCDVNAEVSFPVPISSNKSAVIIFQTDGCRDTWNEVNYLEHVQVCLSIDYTVRGALDLYLVSPSGTETILLTRRPKDKAIEGFKNWKFLTVHLWGESPTGLWKLVIRDMVIF